MDTQLDFDDLDAVLGGGELRADPGELHGLACGLLSAGYRLAAGQWLEQVEKFCQACPDSEQEKALASIYQQSFLQLDQSPFDFYPCLPDDDDFSLGDRLQSMSRWCQGFLHGFASVQAELDGEASETLRDLVAISQVETDVEESNDTEKSYTELQEFIRMAVASLFMEFAPQGGDSVSH